VAGVAATAAGPEQLEADVEPVGEVVDGQRADPGGGELDGEGEAVEGAADVGDPPQQRRAGRDGGVGRLRPIEEQPDRGAALGSPRSGDVQRWNVQDLFASDGEPLAAGGEQ
jgi:hypothetical protein